MKHFIIINFICLSLLSGLLTILSRSPINSILALILTFINVSTLFLLAEAEFLALAFIIIYVGAIAVLFLFIIMMMNVRFDNADEKFLNYIPISLFLGLCVLLQIITIINCTYDFIIENNYYNWLNLVNTVSNIEALGQTLYIIEAPLTILCGFILLLAMVGAITLTLENSKTFQQKQNIFHQINIKFLHQTTNYKTSKY
jgi:NADH-quinone oxidoreductase subunit J